MSDYGIKTYADLAETCRGMVLANEIASRPLEPVSGDWAPWDEIFQWYIVQDPSFLMEHTNEPVFHDRSLTYTCGESRTSGPAGTTCQHLKSIEKGSSLTLLLILFCSLHSSVPLVSDWYTLDTRFRATAQQVSLSTHAHILDILS